MAAHRGATLGTGEGTKYLYAITRHQEQDIYLDFVTGMIKVFTFDIYSFLDPGESFDFVTLYVANKFEVLSEKLYEPFCVSTPVRECILADRLYHDCPISINHKKIMVDLVELDMIDFAVILGMDWLHASYTLIGFST